ncbi:MAG: response regulator [Anaerolineales bacterium]|nr:response regulator [Anaerolineales bacterium]
MEPRILVADDDEVLLDLMLRRIRRLGYSADRAENGSYALEMISSSYYDLIITDIYMPGVTGLDVLERALEKDQKAVVLIITGGATIEKALEALEKGAYFYLTKPFDHLSVFDFMVKRALEYRRMIFEEGTQAQDGEFAGVNGLDPESDQINLLNRAQLYDIVDRYPDGIVVLNPEGDMILCNAIAEKWTEKWWDDQEQALEEFQASNGCQDTAGKLLQLPGGTVRIRSDTFTIGTGKVCTLLALEEEHNSGREIAQLMVGPLDYLKKALTWLFNQKMTTQEFQVIRSMAQQIGKMEALQTSLQQNQNCVSR